MRLTGLGGAVVLVGAEDEDVGYGGVVGRHLLRVFEDGGGCFGVEATEGVVVFRVVVDVLGWCGYH